MNRMTRSVQPSSSRSWYRTAFDMLYPLVYRHRDDASAREEIDALLGLLDLPKPCRTLDIACGGGRHLAAMIDAGLDGFGIDLSAALLAEARERPQLAGRLAQTDMRALPFDGAFDLAVNLFTSFGYFADEAANRRTLGQMVGVLRPGGRLVVDHVNRAYVQRHLVDHDVQRRDGLTVESWRAIEGERMVKRMEIRDEHGRSHEVHESVRLYRPTEMRAMFESVGMTVERMVGSFDGEPLDERAGRMITIGVRA